MASALPPPGRRICIVGTSGVGKTFVAEALGARLGLRYVCNGAIIWGPHWTPTPPVERHARIRLRSRREVDRWLGALVRS